ncbi:MAG: hypothetical protein KC766_03015, partial [Myxococcales bacterium]|nr:hypothetical protein [Myxococcales bacterium]
SAIEQALDDGDELARARREIERLSLALREGRIERRALRAIMERRERDIVLLEEQLQTVKRALERVRLERMELQRRCNEFRARLHDASQGARPAPTSALRTLPRPVRRQLEREQRRLDQW